MDLLELGYTKYKETKKKKREPIYDYKYEKYPINNREMTFKKEEEILTDKQKLKNRIVGIGILIDQLHEYSDRCPIIANKSIRAFERKNLILQNELIKMETLKEYKERLGEYEYNELEKNYKANGSVGTLEDWIETDIIANNIMD